MRSDFAASSHVADIWAHCFLNPLRRQSRLVINGCQKNERWWKSIVLSSQESPKSTCLWWWMLAVGFCFLLHPAKHYFPLEGAESQAQVVLLNYGSISGPQFYEGVPRLSNSNSETWHYCCVGKRAPVWLDEVPCLCHEWKFRPSPQLTWVWITQNSALGLYLGSILDG